MNLDSAANVARQALIATQQQIALSSRNVAAAGDPNRSRTMAQVTTTVDGGVRISAYVRAEDKALYGRMIRSTSATAEADALLSHLTVLADTVGDPEDGVSPAALIGDLSASVADYANSPDDPLFARAAVERAREVANALNSAATEINLMRERADAAAGESVAAVNNLLVRFEEANDAVRRAVGTGQDATLWQDRRDAIVAEISEHMGLTVLDRGGGDLALYTDSGMTLFDQIPRKVEFVRTPIFASGSVGGVVKVDGMPATGPDAPMPLRSGSIVGNLTARDTVANTYRAQLDEIARALEETFADGPNGLFVITPGGDRAGTIAVNPLLDPRTGGNVELLRDGTGNALGDAAYSTRLFQLSEKLRTQIAFDPAAGLETTATLGDFAAGSVGWLENERQIATDVALREGSILSGASEALSRATGVNLDDEYAQQLMIERNFAASSKLISIIDEMFATLLGMT